MKLVIFPVVFQLQNYHDYANRIVYDLRIFIPESLILKLERYAIQHIRTGNDENK